ncbi:cysteine desulfurase family protein [Sphingomonas floccifaciens]|uniref:Cysteine desulfurase n=1 Tax=Sphingomonas floccifaciens TaxID=1844115 RepID=A0ABW4NGE5_9SPHN
MIYLDYQATTPLAPEALDEMLPWLRDGFANPHSPHAAGRRAKAAVEVARDQVAALLPPNGRVSFTSGATEALNWAIKGVAGPVVTLATEHAAVLETADARRDCTVLPVGADGRIDLAAAREAIRPGTALVAAMLVNNEIGTIQPIAELAEIAHAVGALFLCDAVQGYGRLDVPDACDLVAVSAHKIHGPKGVGALWVRDGVTLAPLLHGGGQEAGGRSGTLSPALCAGFGAAAAVAKVRQAEDAAHVAALFDRACAFFTPLPEREGPRVGDSPQTKTRVEGNPPPTPPISGRGGWMLNGSLDHRYRGNLNIRLPGLDVARLMSDLRDIAFSAGSACASGSGRPSHVLRAIGLSDAQARESLRIGFGRYTTLEELDDAMTRIAAAASHQRRAA